MDQATSLSLARIVVGAAAWVAPRTSLRLARLDATAPQSPYLLRAFGVRDVALGAMTLMSPPAVRPALLQVGVGIDSADAAAALLALRAREVRPLTGAVLAGLAGAGVAAGFQALAQQED